MKLRLCASASALLLLVAACQVPAGAATATTTAGEDAPWLADFVEVWTTIRDHFVDKGCRGVDWNAARQRYEPQVASAATLDEATAVINAMLGELRTSHTHYFTDGDPEYYFLFDLFRGVSSLEAALRQRFPDGKVGSSGIGVFTAEIDGQTFVKAVVDGGPAAEAGLLAGDRLVAVEGAPWQPVRPFAGREGQPVRLRVQRTADPAQATDVVVKPRWIAPVDFYLGAMRKSARLIPRDAGKVGYVRVWSYAGRQYQDLLRELVTVGTLATAEVLIVDLRDGWGGANADYLNLFNPRVPRITSIERDGTVQEFDSTWRKPVALLINEGTRSGKELFAFGFKRYGYGPVVGSRSAGAVTGGGCQAIGTRGLLYFARRDILVDGERLEGRGVVPDVEVPFSLPYASGNDPQLERAIDLVLERAR